MIPQILVKIPNTTLHESLPGRGVALFHGTDARMERYDEASRRYWLCEIT